MKSSAPKSGMKPVLQYPASAPAKKIIYTGPSTMARAPGPSLSLKQQQVPGIGLGLGF